MMDPKFECSLKTPHEVITRLVENHRERTKLNDRYEAINQELDRLGAEWEELVKFCPHELNGKPTLTYHFEASLANGKKLFKCDVCGILKGCLHPAGSLKRTQDGHYCYMCETFVKGIVGWTPSSSHP